MTSMIRAVFCAAFAVGLSVCQAQDSSHDRVVGDVGAALYVTRSMVVGEQDMHTVLPYVYADYGRLFARVDTLGIKTLPWGAGHLELVGRISFEGYKANTPRLTGIHARANPSPLGVGTFQETPVGAFFLYGFYDPSSGGVLQEATYAAEFKLGAFTFYPQLGLERRSARYVQHLYGVSQTESQASAYSLYTPGASTSPVFAMAIDRPLSPSWSLNVQLRRKWLDDAVTHSPLVQGKHQDSGFVALTHAFK